MTHDDLRQLSITELMPYLHRRLRFESPVDPPLGHRFGDEPPEQFPLQVAEKDAEFRTRLISVVNMQIDYFAIGQSLARHQCSDLSSLHSRNIRVGYPFWGSWKPLTGKYFQMDQLPDGKFVPWDDVDDEQIASAAFMASALKDPELHCNLFSLGFNIFDSDSSAVIAGGQFHVLRALAFLQSGSERQADHPLRLADSWEKLWHNGPRSIRGVSIYGWAGIDKQAALKQLGDLIDTDGIDLPTIVWTLIKNQGGPGLQAVSDASIELSQDQRDKLQQAMAKSGMTERLL